MGNTLCESQQEGVDNAHHHGDDTIVRLLAQVDNVVSIDDNDRILP